MENNKPQFPTSGRYLLRQRLDSLGFDRVGFTNDSGDGAYQETWKNDKATVTIEWQPKQNQFDNRPNNDNLPAMKTTLKLIFKVARLRLRGFFWRPAPKRKRTIAFLEELH